MSRQPKGRSAPRTAVRATLRERIEAGWDRPLDFIAYAQEVDPRLDEKSTPDDVRAALLGYLDAMTEE